ncbi:MAG: hypothetical protein AAF688_11480, partial [Bacteroidota bacterium]
MKTLITTFLLAFTLLSNSQQSQRFGEISMEKIKTEGISVSVTVDSALDIERTFKVKDIEEVFGMLGENEDLSFEMKCETETNKKGVSKSVTYRAKGNSDQKEEFLQ